MKRTALLSLALALASTAGAQSQPKKRVAVMNFEYGTVSTYVSQIFGSNVDIGKGIADMIVDKLVTAGTYSVIERKALDKILAEQNFSNSDRADPNSAAKLARILGVDAIIIGSITQFGNDDKNTKIGGGGFGGGRFGIGGIGRRESKAIVGLNARVINTDTAEILAVASGKGESQRGGTSLLGAGGGGGSGGGGAFDMSSSNFRATIIGEATAAAVDELAKGLESGASKVTGRVVTIDALVADASGGSLIINVGSRGGIKVGDRLSVRRAIREIKDPASGKVLRKVEESLGEVVITEVDEGSAVGKFNGATPAKVGDSVKSIQ